MDTQSTVTFKKFKSKSIANKRKKSPSPDLSGDTHSHNLNGNSIQNEPEESVVVKKRKELDRTNPLVSSTSNTKKSQTSSAQDSSVNREELQVKYAASGTAAPLKVSDATRVLDVDGNEVTATAKKILSGDQAEAAEGIYTGASNYHQYINKPQSVSTQVSAGKIGAGPLRAPANVRITARFDYQPDICKDYKETGYCGYGDSCKFLHDRGDYKSGWQLDAEWDAKQKKAEELRNRDNFLVESDEENEGNDNDNLPFACLICRGEFKNPVVTKCKHYFCESCALKHHSKSAKCFACASASGGVFNVAKELVVKLAERKKRIEEKSKEIREAIEGQGGMDRENKSETLTDEVS